MTLLFTGCEEVPCAGMEAYLEEHRVPVKGTYWIDLELGVTGKPMLILEEVANLRRWGYQAICLAGYDAKGFLPNWHRVSDRLENIEPETLERAARFTWSLMEEVDAEKERHGDGETR